MAYLPVPSLQTGGLWWFTDLSAADPFYILPIAVTGTMFAILEVISLGVVNENCEKNDHLWTVMSFQHHLNYFLYWSKYFKYFEETLFHTMKAYCDCILFFIFYKNHHISKF